MFGSLGFTELILILFIVLLLLLLLLLFYYYWRTGKLPQLGGNRQGDRDSKSVQEADAIESQKPKPRRSKLSSSAQAIAAHRPAHMATPVVEQPVATTPLGCARIESSVQRARKAERTQIVMETDVQLAPGYIETFAGNGKARSTRGRQERAP